LRQLKRKISIWAEKYLKKDIRFVGKKELTQIDYDTVWNYIINTKPHSEKSVPGAFVDWDNTPRRANRGSVYLGVTPEKFEKYLGKQIKNAKENYKKDFMFI